MCGIRRTRQRRSVLQQLRITATFGVDASTMECEFERLPVIAVSLPARVAPPAAARK